MTSLLTKVSAERDREQREHASRRRRAHAAQRSVGSATEASRSGQIAIRRLDSTGADREALARLAGRDSSETPAGEVIGVTVDERLVAAVSIDSGAAVADPFAPTAELLALLDLRAAQLRDGGDVREPLRPPFLAARLDG